MNETLPLLISGSELAALRSRRDDLVVIDATVWLTLDPEGGPPAIESGLTTYKASHIPGSRFADLLSLAHPDMPARAFTLPPAEHFAAGLSDLGVKNDTAVVVYDQGTGMWATRLWWMLRVFGATDVAVLDGGLAGWEANGGDVSASEETYERAVFNAAMRTELVAGRQQVIDAIDDDGTCLVNALPAALFTGEVPIAAGRAGHIPSSVSVPYNTISDDETHRFSDKAALSERFKVADVLDSPKIVTYCGGGIAATFDAFALALLGRDDVAVYDGSLVDWTSDPDLPLTSG